MSFPKCVISLGVLESITGVARFSQIKTLNIGLLLNIYGRIRVKHFARKSWNLRQVLMSVATESDSLFVLGRRLAITPDTEN